MSDATFVRVGHGDALAWLRRLESSSAHAIITDPPYGLGDAKPDVVAAAITAWATGDRERVPDGRGFMGRRWDAFVPPPAVWDECLRVLKPGGHLAVFAGSRTADLMGLSIRLAGFDMRDGISAWLYGSGFPKSLDVGKAIDKSAGATREVVGTRTLQGKAAQDWREKDGHTYGSVGGSTVGLTKDVDITVPATDAARAWSGWGTALKPAHEPILLARKPLAGTATNVLGMVESSLREHGVEGQIRWTTRPASGAAKRSRTTTSGSTAPQQTAGTSARTASGSATPTTANVTDSSTATPTPRGAAATASTSASTGAARTPNCETPSSTPMAAPAPAAASGSASSSPSTTSTEAGPLTESRSTERSTPSSGEKDSRPGSESYAGIATGLTGSRATVRIERLADGTFVWPDGLPGSVPGGPATVAANTLAHGCGGLNVDACRVTYQDDNDRASARPQGAATSRSGALAGKAQAESCPNTSSPITAPTTASFTISTTTDSADTAPSGRSTFEPTDANGRWPTNVVLAHAPLLDPVTGEVVGDACADGCVPGCHVAALDEQSGMLAAGNRPAVRNTALGLMNDDGWQPQRQEQARQGMGAGGASRFYPTFRYTAKAGKRERPQVWGASCECYVKPVDSAWGIKLAQWCRIAECGECGARAKLTGHPTVKPLGLWRWLTNLLVPPGGAMIDMFAGSGTAGQVAEQVGARAILIEADELSVRMIHERMFRARYRRPSGLNAP